MDEVTPITPESAKPKKKPPRTSTGIRFKPELHEALVIAASERDVTVNWLVNRAVEDFLPRLIPVGELRLTRPVTDKEET